MDSRVFTTIFGLLLAASGLADDIPDLTGEGLSPLVKYAVQRMGAIAAYRRLTASRPYDNVALSPVDALATLSGMYGYYNEVGLSEFFNSFEAEPNRTAAVEKYMQILNGFTTQRDLALSFDIISAHRYGCSRYDYQATRTANGFIDKDDEIIFTSIEKAFPFLESWYRDMDIDVRFDKDEFGERTCDLSAGGSAFRHVWTQNERCSLQSKFHVKIDRSMDRVKYTYFRHNGVYAALPELNAKFIKLQWNVLNLPYGLYVIVPNDLDGLDELERKITERHVRELIANHRSPPTTNVPVDVMLPEIRVTRKYHLLPIMKMVSEDPNPNQIYDVITAATFDAFRASAVDCSLPEVKSPPKNLDEVFLNANHPFLMLVVYEGKGADASMIVGMLGYRTAEQTIY